MEKNAVHFICAGSPVHQRPLEAMSFGLEMYRGYVLAIATRASNPANVYRRERRNARNRSCKTESELLEVPQVTSFCTICLSLDTSDFGGVTGIRGYPLRYRTNFVARVDKPIRVTAHSSCIDHVFVNLKNVQVIISFVIKYAITDKFITAIEWTKTFYFCPPHVLTLTDKNKVSDFISRRDYLACRGFSEVDDGAYRVDCVFTLTPVTEQQLADCVRELGGGSAPGADGITPNTFKDDLESLKSPLLVIINNSLTQGILPDVFKVPSYLINPLEETNELSPRLVSQTAPPREESNCTQKLKEPSERRGSLASSNAFSPPGWEVPLFLSTWTPAESFGALQSGLNRQFYCRGRGTSHGYSSRGRPCWWRSKKDMEKGSGHFRYHLTANARLILMKKSGHGHEPAHIGPQP
ncbi:hypothetical protein J6590_065222 [Homalodisca vitripennis]|nr:hypothetical protein J6590_065222 [Homalodisca vitripennis]